MDAAKVTRSALQNAASIAALFLTTEVIVADAHKKEKMPAMPGRGDMVFELPYVRTSSERTKADSSKVVRG